MSFGLPGRISLPLAIGVIFAAGVVAGAFRYRQTQTHLVAELAVTTRQYAMAFDPGELG